MLRVKILGAGSAGNHLAHASRSLGWEVHLCDTNDAALERTERQIYPGRYGKWDDSIRLFNAREAPRNIYDMVFICTPPEDHIGLAIDALSERPGVILMEKPSCPPNLGRARELYELSKVRDTKICVGYNHVLGLATVKAGEVLSSGVLGGIETVDVEFREHWQGIFNAHPWLSGPRDTYLGSWRRGGGASGEHSHAINLWQHISHVSGAGRVVEVSAMLDYVDTEDVNYDKLCLLNLRTESGLVGRVVQDVITTPPKKWGRVQGANGSVEWHFGLKPGVDAVFYRDRENNLSEYLFEKTRPDDFIVELRHLQGVAEGRPLSPGITLERGLDTVLIIAAAHLSARSRRSVSIDYSKGYVPDALSLL